jgi:hypothetical protein
MAGLSKGDKMKRATITTVLVLAFAASIMAKPKTRTFQQPCSVVFPAAEKLASAPPYKLQLDGKTDMNLIVETGSFWKAGAAQIIVQFAANTNGTCTVTDNSPYSGVRRNGTVFLDRLEKILAESSPPK